MKTFIPLALLVVAVVLVVIFALRRGRGGSPPRRQFPGPDLAARDDGVDSTFIYTAASMGSDPAHHHAGPHGGDCAPSHDAGAGCSTDGGGDGGHY